MTAEIKTVFVKDAQSSLDYSATITDFETKEVGNNTGEFTGYAAIYGNVDHGRDRIEAGAFDACVKKRGAAGIKLLNQHRPDQPIGVLISVESDAKGLKVTGQLLLGIARAWEVWTLMRAGALDSMSIGYALSEKDVKFVDGIRNIKRVDVREVSIVTFPMNDRARVTSVKSDELRVEDFVNFFEEHGILQGQDATIAAKAAVHALNQPEADAGASQLEALKSLSKTINPTERSEL